MTRRPKRINTPKIKPTINTPKSIRSAPPGPPYLPYLCFECMQKVRLAAPIFMHDEGTEDVCRDCWHWFDYGFFYTDDDIVKKWGLIGLLDCVEHIDDGILSDDGVCIRPAYAMTPEFEAELTFLRGPYRIRDEAEEGEP
jgi:hypothetical protein